MYHNHHFQVLETVAALLGKNYTTIVSNFIPEDRGKYPIVIVLQEAHK